MMAAPLAGGASVAMRRHTVHPIPSLVWLVKSVSWFIVISQVVLCATWSPMVVVVVATLQDDAGAAATAVEETLLDKKRRNLRSGSHPVSSAFAEPEDSVSDTAVAPRPGTPLGRQLISSNTKWTLVQESEDYVARHENCLAFAGNRFYVMGGREMPQQVDAYDYHTDSWSTVASMPFPFNHAQTLEYEGFVWMVAALQNNQFPMESPATAVYVYDPANDVWMKGPTIPASRRRGGGGVAVYQGKFYVSAGSKNGHDGGYVDYFDEYNPHLGTWEVLHPVPRPRDHCQAAVIGNKYYVAGGRWSGGYGGANYPLIPQVDVYDFDTEQWSTLPDDLPTTRAGVSVVAFQGQLVVIGGEAHGNAWKSTEAYDPDTETWTKLADLNFARHGTQAVVTGNGIITAAGSHRGGGGRQRNMEVFGTFNPQGRAPTAGVLSGPGGTQQVFKDVTFVEVRHTSGNTGVFVTKLELIGGGKNKFELDKGSSPDKPFLIAVGATRFFGVKFKGGGGNPKATLQFTHSGGKKFTISIQGIDSDEGTNPSPTAPPTPNPNPPPTRQPNPSPTAPPTPNPNPPPTRQPNPSPTAPPTPSPNPPPTRQPNPKPRPTPNPNPPPTPVPTPETTAVVSASKHLYINAGATAPVTLSGNEWIPDTPFATGGRAAKWGGQMENKPLYLTERWGAFSYHVPLPNALYKVVFHFAEIFDPNFFEGARIFNIRVEEGQAEFRNVDIFAQVGGLAPYTLEATVRVRDQELTVDFLKTPHKNPKVSGMEIILVEEKDDSDDDSSDDEPKQFAVTTLMLINAETDQDLFPLVDGATYSFSRDLPTKKLNIRADTSNSPQYTVKSVQFTGTYNTRTEGAAPYAFAGDKNGDYLEASFDLGPQSFVATPYSQPKAKGTRGTPLAVTVTFVE